MLTLLLLYAVLCPARAERPMPPEPRNLTIGADVSYFKSESNFDQGGSAKGLLNGAHFENLQAALGARYDFTRYLRMSAAFSFAHSSGQSVDPQDLNGNTVGKSGSGPNEVYASALAWFNPVPFLALAPELNVAFPTWRVSEGTDSPLLGEGALRFSTGGWLIGRFDRFQPFLFGAYEYRDGGRSSLAQYSAGLHFEYKLWWAQAGYRGYFSVSGDSDSENRLPRDTVLSRVNGGSYRFYSVEPEYGEGVFETGIRVKSWSVYAGFAISAAGKSAADGQTFFGGVAYTADWLSRPSSEPSNPDRFKIQNEKYDESLFINEKKEEPKKIRKKIRKGPSVDKLLHETEKELQQE